jgi:predicted nuclease of restriction endonuclease-like (RecB) superfamily
MNKEIAKTEQTFINEIKTIIQNGQSQAYRAISSTMVETYWNLGKRIVEQEQQGKERAEYGAGLLKRLSVELNKEFGKGYSLSNLKDFRQFFITFTDDTKYYTVCNKLQDAETQLVEKSHTVCGFSEKSHAVRGQFDNSVFNRLSWSHIRSIMRVSNPEARAYYLREAAENTWPVRTLDRNISTLYYQRLLSSQVKAPVIAEMQEKTKDFKIDPLDFIKNPSVLDFLQLPANMAYTESELERAIIDHMQRFLLELGKGFAFVDRQKLIRTETSDFYIDLVFYNYILKCFVIIELKTNKITHQDIGQLDMYVRMYDDLERGEGDNPTIGILLCTETDQVIAKYSVLNESKHVFATKYMDYLPTEEELTREIERQKAIYLQEKNNK